MFTFTRAICLTVLLGTIASHPTESQTLRIGDHAGGFAVQETTGSTVRYSTGNGKVMVVAFISVRCPISNAFNSRLNDLYLEFSKQVDFVVVNSNANESLEAVRRHSADMGYDFPVYKDIGNAVADLFGAVSTPDAFVIDRRGNLQYHGYIEDAPNPARSKNRALRLAIEAALVGQPAPFPETHSFGCSIRRSQDQPNTIGSAQ